MIWLFHRYGEYLSCEVRTCLENAGFELLVARSGQVHLEWYPDESQIERRWQCLTGELRRDGWGEISEQASKVLYAGVRRPSLSRRSKGGDGHLGGD